MRCTLCGRSFYMPAEGEGLNDRSFRGYIRSEVISAVVFGGEPTGVVALRAGVTQRTVRNWLRRVGREGRVNPIIPRDEWWRVDVRAGRRARRVGAVGDTPFVVSERDVHRYQKAIFGELRYWLEQEALLDGRQVDAMWSLVQDGARTTATRDRVISEVRGVLAEARPDLTRL